ncbi:unnamed protein product [Heterobilharzia americana]|nr:unnamed protein product [Heterobilharzia americana]
MKKQKYCKYLIDLFKKDKTLKDNEEELRDLNWYQRLVKKAYPLGFLFELKALLRLAIPISISSVFTYTIAPVSMAFCGHLGKFQLATMGLAMSVFSVCGMFVILGLLTACDTLFSQTYGSTAKDKMVLQLYRAVVLISLCCIPSCALYLNAEPILLLLGQNPIIAKGTADLLIYLIPALFFGALGQLLIKFVQTQNCVYAPLFIMILVNGVNALMHYILIYLLKMDVSGSPISQATAYAFEVICFIVYIKFKGISKNMNFKPTLEIWDDWSTWFRLAIPGLIMVSLEWTIYEIGGFVAGTLGARELAAQTIVITIGSVCYTLIPHGVGSATGIRVGQYLGSGSAKGPHSVFSVAITLVGAWALPYLGILIALRWHLPKIFTFDNGVIELVAELMPIISVFQLSMGQMVSVAIEGNLDWFSKRSNNTSINTMRYCFKLNWTTQIKLALQRIKAENDSSELPTKNLGELYATGILKVEEDDTLSVKHSQQNELTVLSKNESTLSKSKVHTINKKIIRNRAIFILILLLLLISSILCRIFLNLPDFFGVYCVYSNDTFININSNHFNGNCTVVVP